MYVHARRTDIIAAISCSRARLCVRTHTRVSKICHHDCLLPSASARKQHTVQAQQTQMPVLPSCIGCGREPETRCPLRLRPSSVLRPRVADIVVRAWVHRTCCPPLSVRRSSRPLPASPRQRVSRQQRQMSFALHTHSVRPPQPRVCPSHVLDTASAPGQCTLQIRPTLAVLGSARVRSACACVFDHWPG